VRSVLGIDAAWTTKNPSGVALVAETSNGWELIRVAGSYSEFVNPENPHQSDKNKYQSCNVNELLRVCNDLLDDPVELIAIDMPLSFAPINARRVADDSVSAMYARNWCATHSPNCDRPGAVGQRLYDQLTLAEYPLMTERISGRGMIEVYPHPALVELMGTEKRLPYKHSKMRNYWPDHSPEERRVELRKVWHEILIAMERRILGIAECLDAGAEFQRGSEWKRFEDILDAIVCAFVGICALDGLAVPLGNVEAAIWIPTNGGLKA